MSSERQQTSGAAGSPRQASAPSDTDGTTSFAPGTICRTRFPHAAATLVETTIFTFAA